MLKRLGLPLLALAAMLTFAIPKPAQARVRFGVVVGAPPVYPQYCSPYDPYCTPYNNPYEYPYVNTYPYGYSYQPYVYNGWGWGHRDHEWREHERHEHHEFRGGHEHGHEHGHDRGHHR